MPLQKQVQTIPFGLGLAEKVDSRYVRLTGAAQMVNCVQLRQGAVQKRLGCASLPTSFTSPDGSAGNVTTCLGGGAYSGSPLLYGAGAGANAYTLTYSAQAQAWAPIGMTPNVGIKDRIPLTQRPNFQSYAYDFCNGYHVFAYIAEDGILYAMCVDASGALVVPPKQITNSGGIGGLKLVSRQTGTPTTYLLWTDGTDVRWASAAMTAPTRSTFFSAGAALVAAGGNSAVGVFDIMPVGNADGNFSFVYLNSASTHLVLDVLSSAMAVTSTALLASPANIDSVSVQGTVNEGHWVAYKATGGAVFMVQTPDTALTLGLPTMPISVVASTATGWGNTAVVRLAAKKCGVLTSPLISGVGAAQIFAATIHQAVVTLSGATLSSSGDLPIPNLLMHSRPMSAQDGNVYGMVFLPSALQGTQYLIRFDGLTGFATANNYVYPIATVAPRLFQTPPAQGGPTGGSPYQALAHMVPTGASGFYALTMANWSVGSPTNIGANSLAAYVQPFDLAETRRFSGGQLAQSLVVAGGQTTNIDGQVQTETGWAYYPEATANGTNAGSIPSGTYSWCFTYEWTDANGNIHQSAPSPPIQRTLSGPIAAVFSVPGIAATYRQIGSSTYPIVQSDPKIVGYRTDAGGTVFFRLPNEVDALINQAAFTDDTTSVTSPALPELYTTGGVVPNMGPPSSRIALAHQGRWWLAGCDDPTVLWPSQNQTNGFGPGFNEILNVQCSGAIRALASMDDKLVAFVQRASGYGLEFLVGLGPTNAGTSSDWGLPAPIPGNLGAIDQRSVVVTDKGILFQAGVGGRGFGLASSGGGGIFLLDRGLTLTYIGAAVETALASFPVVTSAVLHPTNGRVYFTCVASEPSPTSGVRLVYDTVSGVWSEDVLFGGGLLPAVAGYGANALFPVLQQPGLGYFFVAPSGTVYREQTTADATPYLDLNDGSPAWVTMVYQTSRVQASSGRFARWWRVQVSGDVLDQTGSFTLTHQLTFDGAPAATYAESVPFNFPVGSFGYGYPQFDVEQIVGNQKAREISLTITDSAGATLGTGQGASFGQMVLEFGVDGSRYPNIPAAARG